ncbi:GNAT family [Colletotrichum kahawae]|uniref:GNAT family n=1 Tax=Colletotrichum kahawae TaxID=34407 RepID=A0AAD9YTM3_COLKA|nr:GNAT family [Colletotrichum kahawae]
MTVRTATHADLPAIQVIITKALPADYQWKYCFPARLSVKHDSGMYVQCALEQTLAPGNSDWLVCVTEDPGSRKPVGVAVWSWTDARIQEHTGEDVRSQGLTVAGEALGGAGDIVVDGGPTVGINTGNAENPRIVALSNAVAACRDRQLARYGQQLHLHVVAIHPEYQRLGHAKLLCQHGMHLAKEKGLAVSAVTSSSGYIFFSGLGFADCGHVVVQVSGEKEEIGLKAMVLAAPQQEKRRGSFLGMIGLGERRRSSDVRTSKS